MTVGSLRNKIDHLWLQFWQGGITNPITVIEQITYLMFFRLLDIQERRDEKRMQRTGENLPRRFADHEQHIRWSSFSQLGDSMTMLRLIRDEAFGHIKQLGDDVSMSQFIKDARLAIDKPELLRQAVELISELPLENTDSKGDLYEYLLSKLSTAGIAGQFRTPRHIIQMMVELVDPQPEDHVADPSCGTGGFLVESMNYVMKENTSEDGIIIEKEASEEGGEEKIYTGDELSSSQRNHMRTTMFTGFDFDITMLRFSAMNLFMHGIDQPNIHYQDTLAQSFSDHHPELEQEAFDVVLANPPFKGAIDKETISPDLHRSVSTTKTELLFIAQILRMLKKGGRSATIVPQGVLFGSSKAHVAIRRKLIEEHQLEAVIDMPSGVFKPYAGVATAVLVFVKGGQTDHVLFLKMNHDGYSLDDKRDPSEENDIPVIIDGYKQWKLGKGDYSDKAREQFVVEKAILVENDYDLAFKRYYEEPYKEVVTRDPNEILRELKDLENEITRSLEDLEELLK